MLTYAFNLLVGLHSWLSGATVIAVRAADLAAAAAAPEVTVSA
jgi:hypothetical protein